MSTHSRPRQDLGHLCVSALGPAHASWCPLPANGHGGQITTATANATGLRSTHET